MPRVSVIIPSYNHGKYIKEAIQSVIDQTFQDFEIIITDDGSVDNTVEEIKKFKDKRIKLFVFPENKGACVAANNCVKHSSGKYIAMLSSDDIFFPDKLEKQVIFLDNNPNVGVVFSKAQIINEDGNIFEDTNHPYYSIFDVNNRSRYEWLNYFFYKGNCLCHPSALIRKMCYEKVGLYDERFASLPDMDLWVRICMHFDIYVMNEKLIKFRIRNNEENASGNRLENKIRYRLEYKQILKNYLNFNSLDDLQKVFPDINKINKIKNLYNKKLIPYYIAQISLQSEIDFANLFGIELLFDLMNDKETIRLLDNNGFSFRDLIKITSQYDVFKIFNNNNINNNFSENRYLKIATFIDLLLKFELRKATLLIFEILKKRLKNGYNKIKKL